MEYKITVDNRDKVLEATHEQVEKALEAIGLQAEGYVAMLTPVDTGRLRDSITHEVKGDTVYIGTNVEYAPYIEFGTGIYADSGGRKTPWWYKDDKGEWHFTHGSQPHHMLQRGIEQHLDEYKQIAEEFLKDG